jgi:hypothetical protein
LLCGKTKSGKKEILKNPEVSNLSAQQLKKAMLHSGEIEFGMEHCNARVAVQR